MSSAVAVSVESERPARSRFVSGLACRECGSSASLEPVHVCEQCFGPLEVRYDYAAIREALTRATIAARPHTMWRYAELLPLDGPPSVGLQTGMTPLLKADRLARRLGIGEVWIKN